jgi:hypothetical protein
MGQKDKQAVKDLENQNLNRFTGTLVFARDPVNVIRLTRGLVDAGLLGNQERVLLESLRKPLQSTRAIANKMNCKDEKQAQGT